MKNVDIRVYNIGKTSDNREEIKRWLASVGATQYEHPTSLSGSESISGLAAKRCYMSFEPGLNPNVTKVRKNWHDYFENILRSGHGSTIEHATYTFAIEGVSRVFTGEMNRHRAGVAVSEGSMRYIRFTDIPWWLPTSIAEKEGDSVELAEKKRKTREAFSRVYTFVEKEYSELVKLWELDSDTGLPFHVKKVVTSCLRRIIPMGVATGGVWTFNLRALRHIIALRTSEAAEEEIAHVCSLIAVKMLESEPLIFGDFTKTAEGYWIPAHAKV